MTPLPVPKQISIYIKMNDSSTRPQTKFFAKHLEAIWESLRLKKHLGSIWDASEKHLGSIWEASGKHLGSIWEASGKHLGSIWDSRRPWGSNKPWKQLL